MSQILLPFGSADFIIYANRNATIRIAIQDQSQNWIQPPFTTGYFSIEPYARQTPEPIIFARDTHGLNVRFTSLVAGQWYLDSDILPADTLNLLPGIYRYEARLDFSGGQYELKTGLFSLIVTYV